jgi:hypothetical protein
MNFNNSIKKCMKFVKDEMHKIYFISKNKYQQMFRQLEIFVEYNKYGDNISSATFLSNSQNSNPNLNCFVGIGMHLEAGLVIIFVGFNDEYFMCSPSVEIKNHVVLNKDLCILGLYLIYEGFYGSPGLNKYLKKKPNMLKLLNEQLSHSYSSNHNFCLRNIFIDNTQIKQKEFYDKFNNQNKTFDIIGLNKYINNYFEVYKIEEILSKKMYDEELKNTIIVI